MTWLYAIEIFQDKATRTMFAAIFSSLDISMPLLINHTVNIFISFVLALPLGYNRETRSHSAGLRTFPLVSVASCGFTLLTLSVVATPDAQSRMLQGIITGVGFIGGGAIIKNNEQARGLATASSIWVTGAIGMAVGWQRYEIAILLSLITFMTLRYVSKVKEIIINEDER